jgi:hypothetical protein
MSCFSEVDPVVQCSCRHINENRFLYEKIWGELEILSAYNRRIHHSNVNDKNVHPLICPKIRMAKVRNDGIPKKQILDQNGWIFKIEGCFCQMM